MRLNAADLKTIQTLYENVAYEHELDCAVRKCRKALAAVGCKLHRQGNYVSLISPDTGTHTLNLTRGVRPVYDLVIHCKGFIELQPHAKPLVRW